MPQSKGFENQSWQWKYRSSSGIPSIIVLNVTCSALYLSRKANSHTIPRNSFVNVNQDLGQTVRKVYRMLGHVLNVKGHPRQAELSENEGKYLILNQNLTNYSESMKGQEFTTGLKLARLPYDRFAHDSVPS